VDNKPGGVDLNREADEKRWSSLMASAQLGHEADYQQLLQELSQVILDFLCSRFGNHHFPDDCVQEALIAIHHARHTYDPGRAFRPWMFTIVRHKAIDMFRQHRSRNSTLDQFRVEQQVALQGSELSANPEALAGGSVLESLKEQHREVLVLTKVLGFSVAETAGQLGISQGAVKVRVHRAVGKLRKLLEQDDIESSITASR
jgi:RNA polymerase sigma-70 factor (ECF subfamily)